jgi:hypothetical protein
MDLPAMGVTLIAGWFMDPNKMDEFGIYPRLLRTPPYFQ